MNGGWFMIAIPTLHQIKIKLGWLGWMTLAPGTPEGKLPRHGGKYGQMHQVPRNVSGSCASMPNADLAERLTSSLHTYHSSQEISEAGCS